MPRRITLSIFLLFTLASLARADYHYASHSGSNTYPYTSWETAADSIQAAVNATNPHDTVYVGGGDWWEAVAVQPDDSVAFIGMGIDSTICHYDSLHGMIFVLDNGCSIEGFTLKDAMYGAGVEIRTYAGGSVSVKSCKFIKDKDGVSGSGFPFVEISDCIFDSCNIPIVEWVGIGSFYIANNLILNSTGTWDILLEVESALVEKNIIINDPNNNTGMCSICGAPGYSVIRNNYIANTTVGFDNADSGYNNILLNFNIGGNATAMGAADGSIIFNNLLVNNRRGISLVGDGITVKYNDFWKNRIDIEDWGNLYDSVGNIFQNPMLVGESDYRLQAFSPLIDAGDPTVFDVDGTRSDIGVYGGPGGSSYVYLDLAPQIPDSISGHVTGDTIALIWRNNYEADFNRYQIFRDTISGFTPSSFNMIAEPETSFYQDIITNSNTSYYYRLTSVDNQHNVSDMSGEVAVIFSSIPPYSQDGLPRYSVISSAYPNPFNSRINIVYSASNLGPQPPEIKLVIYDITGREIRTLVNERKPAGTYRAIWDGKDDNGNSVASGSYLARVSQWGMYGGDFPIKITLVK